ncbi:hypothetical protein D9613_007461 [Agrocybe pediades]|uniref:Tyrosinase copper-binding domain-containing protein n=1 Tax=Agrocybe pediades TaxID=84607 RepID=A0A8H4VJZ4_9AGAR|nr:hypothetical protein D9613_007461 [Agrocybe pediades]
MVHAAAVPYNNVVSEYQGQHPCDNPIQRREWRALSDDEKGEYIDAVKCLQSKAPYNTTIKAAKSRFDEFQSFRITIADDVHFVGQFLPWHRLFVRNYEKALRDEYWDWTLDSKTPEDYINSPVWDPITGFGPNGVPGTYTLPPFTNDSRIFPDAFRGCVQDGPFANYTLSLGPGKLVTEHCLVRGFNTTAATRYLTPEQVANTTKQETFETFRIELEGGDQTPDRKIHDGGHISVGGDGSNFLEIRVLGVSSFYPQPFLSTSDLNLNIAPYAADPIFYLHHTNLDRIWWIWQNLSPSHLYEISGSSSVTNPTAPNVHWTLRF